MAPTCAPLLVPVGCFAGALLANAGCDTDPGVAPPDDDSSVADDDDTTPDLAVPDPGDWPPNAGPGGPVRTFAGDELYRNCAVLHGDEQDRDHHNLVASWDGYLLLPWAPEWGGGGLSFFEFDDPCAPVRVGWGYSTRMRESHTIGFSRLGGGRWAVVNDLLGIQVWDIADVGAPTPAAILELPGVFYPDAYARVVLAVFWQGRWVYAAAADNGVFVVDVSDPLAPVLATQVTFDPPLRVGSFLVLGNLGVAMTAEGTRTVLLDVSDPLQPRPIPGGDFHVTDRDGAQYEYYFGNLGGAYAWFARKESGGGPVVWDLRDPTQPRFVGDWRTPDGNGGYVFLQHEHAFVGDSSFASVYDVSDPAAPVEIGRGDLEGDLDTATPYGNVAILSVDDDAIPGEASAVMPWDREPDTRGPTVAWTVPGDGDTFQAPTTRVGLSFDESVDMASVFEGSFRVARADGIPVRGDYNAQETVVNFTPDAPLEADTTYVVTVPAGGVVDWNGNPTGSEVSFRFSTGADVER